MACYLANACPSPHSLPCSLQLHSWFSGEFLLDHLEVGTARLQRLRIRPASCGSKKQLSSRSTSRCLLGGPAVAAHLLCSLRSLPDPNGPFWFAWLKPIYQKCLMSYVFEGRCVYHKANYTYFLCENTKRTNTMKCQIAVLNKFSCVIKTNSFFSFFIFSSGVHISIFIKAQSEEGKCM